MASPTLWERLNIELPKLPYVMDEVMKQADDSTKWASHSHTPVSVSMWNDFEKCITREATKDENSRPCPTDLHALISSIMPKDVLEEEDVTQNTERFLQPLKETAGVVFSSTTKYTISNPDLIASRPVPNASKREGWTVVQPKMMKNREMKRKRHVEKMSENVLFTVETKPVWKFQFLLSHSSAQVFTENWEFPVGFTPEDLYNKRTLPSTWSDEKKKVFHLLRQAYGQMTSSKRKYGVIHIYEKWWFCCRTTVGDLRISHPFDRDSKSPSVLQALITLANFDDIVMDGAVVHPGSARKADERVAAQRKRNLSAGAAREIAGKKNKGSSALNKGGTGTGAEEKADGSLVHEIPLWDCTLVDVTDNVQLLTPTNYPTMLIKLQRDSRAYHIASEMEHEASIYEALSKRGDVAAAIPQYFGLSTRLGVSMLFLSMEGSNFDDIGLENLSLEMKSSAVDCLQRLSAIGVLHNDIALRNIVQDRTCPTKAKIIDFGRAEFCTDKVLLQGQVKALKLILGLD